MVFFKTDVAKRAANCNKCNIAVIDILRGQTGMN